MDKLHDKHTDLGRRRFLLAAGLGGAGAALVATGRGGPQPAADAATPEAEPPGRGYRETRHVLTYYRTTRI